MKKHFNIRIFGNVQGVFFRDSAGMKAEEFGITGFARNEPDGTVYMEAEGEEEALSEFLKWCKTGPELAKVEKIEFSPGDVKDFKKDFFC